MARLRGWGSGGDRVLDFVPGGHWQTHTLIHAIALDGTRAAMILDGPVNSDCFSGFCERLLAPAMNPGDLVIMDNLSSHKSSTAVAEIESAGASVVYLPAYSPDLNPIENIFSKLKQLIRSHRPRTWKQVIEATKKTLLKININEIQNAFEHSGDGFA